MIVARSAAQTGCVAGLSEPLRFLRQSDLTFSVWIHWNENSPEAHEARAAPRQALDGRPPNAMM